MHASPSASSRSPPCRRWRFDRGDADAQARGRAQRGQRVRRAGAAEGDRAARRARRRGGGDHDGAAAGARGAGGVPGARRRSRRCISAIAPLPAPTRWRRRGRWRRRCAREPFDLVLCGRNSVDAETGQVGPEIAELLDWPQVTVARTLDVDLAARTAARRARDRRGHRRSSPRRCRRSSPPPRISRPSASPPRPSARPRAAKPIATRHRGRSRARPRHASAAAGSPTWVLGLEAVEEHRRREMIEAETPGGGRSRRSSSACSAHGLFGEWTVERPAPPPLRERTAVGARRRSATCWSSPRRSTRSALRPVAVGAAAQGGDLAPLLQRSGERRWWPAPAPRRHVDDARGARRGARARRRRRCASSPAAKPFAALLAGGHRARSAPGW